MNPEAMKILVVGDIMLDKYVEGDITRISPEAPVAIVEVKNEYHTLGGAGNVVRNLRELGCQVDCLASIGVDIDGEIIKNEVKSIGANSLLFYGSKQTTVKERIIASERKVQMLRIDRENTTEISPHKSLEIFKHCCRDNYNMIIVSDYAKGMISQGLMEFLKHEQNADIIVDPKPKNAGIYNGVFMITPNEKEWQQMSFSSPYTLKNVKFILETKGSKGMKLIDNTNNQVNEIPSDEVQVYNVSGCGDVVVAVMSVCLGMSLDPVTSAKIANKCAGYTASLPGTSVIPKNKFTQYLNSVIGGYI